MLRQSPTACFLILTVFGFASIVSADGVGVVESEQADSATRDQQLATYLTGKKFVGKFTVDGKDTPPKTEEYVISKCESLPAANMFRLTARIKYGQIDQQVPMEVKILFAGKTPVITLDSLWIPGMGTFDARVLIRRDHYAGTWKHGEVGGHLFGTIEPADDSGTSNSQELED